jgi:hypothetical protein
LQAGLFWQAPGSALRQKRKAIDMFKTKCPHCGAKLGDFLYAVACPHCHEVLKHNLPIHTPVHLKVVRAKSWPVRAFFSIVRFVES